MVSKKLIDLLVAGGITVIGIIAVRRASSQIIQTVNTIFQNTTSREVIRTNTALLGTLILTFV
jgi:hypothetical protein